MRPDDPVARELAAYEHLQRNSSGTQARERHDLPGPRPGEARRAPQARYAWGRAAHTKRRTSGKIDCVHDVVEYLGRKADFEGSKLR